MALMLLQVGSAASSPITDWVPSLGQAVILVLAAAAVALWYKVLRVPSNLASIPGIGPFQTIKKVVWEKIPAMSLHRGIMDKCDKPPGLIRVWFGSHMVIACGPEEVKRVATETGTFAKANSNGASPFSRWLGNNLVTTNGDVWQRQRRVISPAFHFDFLRELPEPFSRACGEMIDVLAESQGEVLPIHEYMQRVTLDVLGLTMLDFNFGATRDPNSEYVTIYNRIVSGIFNPGSFLKAAMLRKVLPDHVAKKYILSADLADEIKRFDSLLYRIIQQRMEKGHDVNRKDLLECMLSSASDGDHALTETEIRDNLVVFFLAGHDTTASSLAMALWNLAHHPEVQAKVHEEIDAVMAGPTDRPDYDQQAHLTYLTQVIKETMRRTPSVFNFPPRIVTKPTTLGGCQLNPGQVVGVSIGGLHHNKSVWPDSDRFDPDRFAKDSEKRHPFSWVPFGAGPRVCIGNNFSLMEQRIFLSMLLKRFVVKPRPGSRLGDVTFKTGSLSMPQGLGVSLHPRTEKPAGGMGSC